MSRINTFCKNGRVFLLQAYIMIMAVVYPLYMRGNYTSIGKDKYLFYRYMTMSMLATVFICSVVCFVISHMRILYMQFKSKRKNGTCKFETYVIPVEKSGIGKRFSSTEWAAILFLGAAGISFFLSPFRQMAWPGAEGWFMGLETLLLIVVTCLFISRMWEYSGYVWAGFLAGSVIVYVLGICNRFSFYPVYFKEVAPDFISTLGNINWFCSFLSVIWPISACFYLFTGKRWIRAASAAVTVVAFASGVTQGSSSVFLSFIAVFYLLLLICTDRWGKYGRRWLELAIYWCVTCQIVRVVRILLPGKYNYDTENLCGKVTGSSFSIYLFVLLLLLYILPSVLYRLKFFNSNKIKSDKKLKIDLVDTVDKMDTNDKMDTFDTVQVIRILKSKKRNETVNLYWNWILILVPVGAVILYFLLVAANTLLPGGIPGLTENSLFVFNQSWGNARGATWGTGLELFARMDWRQKLFGAGPDCFVEYLYTCPDIMENIHEIFDGYILKNAHNEWITMLVNVGIVGTAAYAGIFVTLFVRYLKMGKEHPVLYIPVVCAFSYIVHNMVSFGQVLNMPFLFIIMGIGESYIRQYKKKEVKQL